MPVRRGTQGRAQALGVQGVRHRLHTGNPHRHVHGVTGGRLRRVLQLRPAEPAASPRGGLHRAEQAMTHPLASTPPPRPKLASTPPPRPKLTTAPDPARPLHGLSVLVIGAGSMSSLAGATAARLGAAGIVVANRTQDRAKRLAASVHGGTADLADLPNA